MRRGQFVVVVLSGDYGKPRPALVVQSDLFSMLNSVTVCPLTTHDLAENNVARIDVQPTEQNGLRQASQIMIDKLTSLPVAKVGQNIGVADPELMGRVNRALGVFIGLY